MKKSFSFAFNRKDSITKSQLDQQYSDLLELKRHYDEENETDWLDLLLEEEKQDVNGNSIQNFDSNFNELDRNCFFADGIRKIDYIITWEEEINSSTSENVMNKNEQYRKKFEENLRKMSVEMEKDSEKSDKIIIHCVKIHIPWKLLCKYAEDVNLRAPLQIRNKRSENNSSKILKLLRIPNIMQLEIPRQPLSFFTCNFKAANLERYIGYKNHLTFFTSTQRQQVAYRILATQVYGKRRKAEIGIDRLLEEGIYSAAYPLHDGPYQSYRNNDKSNTLNQRQILYENWARWSKWYKYQPLDHIREYYGEKIALYFAWLGMYTVWLIPSSLTGILVFLYGLLTVKNNIPTIEICESNESYRMCPLCNENIGCPYWYLSDVCFYSKITYMFDHPGTIFFSIFMAFWAVSFLESWKRKHASLTYYWDVIHYEEEEQRPRPEYTVLCPSMKKNPVTGLMEPYFPKIKRLFRYMTGISVITLMFVLIIIFIVAVIIYRVLIAIPLFQNPLLRSKAIIFANTSAAIVNLILIMCLGRVYEKLAYKITQWEMHRTQTEFEDHLILKVYLFQFVNFYSSIFYIAFFKGRFNGYPGNYSLFFGLRNEECSNGSCLFELAQQLAIIMIGKQIINNFLEIFFPKMLTRFYRFSKGLHKVSIKDVNSQLIKFWAEDYKLLPYEGLFEEYLEMVLQFGFITIFVAAFPLAPVFALLNNWVEIRLDAKKLVCETRRPISERAQDIGKWYLILDATVHLSVISNAFLIAFTSEFIPKVIYKYQHDENLRGYVNFTLSWAPNGSLSKPCRYRAFRNEHGNYTLTYWQLLAIRFGFVIIFEHVVFSIAHMIDIVIPDIPYNLQVKMRRENYLANQALLKSKKAYNVPVIHNLISSTKDTLKPLITYDFSLQSINNPLTYTNKTDKMTSSVNG